MTLLNIVKNGEKKQQFEERIQEGLRLNRNSSWFNLLKNDVTNYIREDTTLDTTAESTLEQSSTAPFIEDKTVSETARNYIAEIEPIAQLLGDEGKHWLDEAVESARKGN